LIKLRKIEVVTQVRSIKLG